MNHYKLLSKIRPIELGQAIKWLLRPKRICVEAEACAFWVDPLSNFGGNLISRGTYEPDLTKAVKSLLRPGDSFVDVGANEGWYSVIASRAIGPSGSSIVIEPQERCWPAIHRNFILNQMFNYRLVPYAIGDREGEVDIVLYPSLNCEASSLVSQRRSRRFARQKTNVIRLDSVANELNLRSIKLVKIDCEGYELNALKGAENLLRQGTISHLLVELHPRQLHELGQRESDIADYLKSLNYGCSTVGPITLWTHISVESR